MRAWFFAGAISAIVSLIVYVLLYRCYKDSFLGMSLLDKLMYLVSHVPDDRSPAWPHITAGVLFCGGLCLMAGTAIACLPFVEKNLGQHGTALTAGSLVFGVLISMISFWTLWQTKRIEQLQGINITGFRNLVVVITREIERVNKDFLAHGCRASVNHRIFLATTNPCFGYLSFPHSKEERGFANAMGDAGKNVAASRGKGARTFQMKVLCGEESLVHSFNEAYFKNAEPGLTEEKRTEAVKDADEHTEKFISGLDANAKEAVVKRQKNLPTVQFAVVGNVVLEFILLEPRSGASTGLAGARRIEDRLVCDRFCQQLELLERIG